MAHGLWTVGSVVEVHRLGYLATCGIFPAQGIKPMSPALAGRFLTTELLREVLLLIYFLVAILTGVRRYLIVI